MPETETIVPIDIAKQLRSGLATALSGVTQTDPDGDASSVTLQVDGYQDTTGARVDSLTLPCVAVRVHEGYGHDFAQGTKLREYPVTIVAATHYSADPWQTALYTIGQKVGDYLLSPPTLTLSSATFRALHVPTPPERGETEGRVQLMTWNVIVHVIRTT